MQYQTTSTYGFSPEQIQFGHSNARPSDPMLITATPLSQPDHYQHVQKNLETIFAAVSQARARKRELNESLGNEHRKKRDFQEGQIVYVYQKLIQNNSGMAARKRGPYIIEKISEARQTAFLRELSTGKNIKAHFSYLTKVLAPPLFRDNSGWDKTLLDWQEQRLSER